MKGSSTVFTFTSGSSFSSYLKLLKSSFLAVITMSTVLSKHLSLCEIAAKLTLLFFPSFLPLDPLPLRRESSSSIAVDLAISFLMTLLFLSEVSKAYCSSERMCWSSPSNACILSRCGTRLFGCCLWLSRWLWLIMRLLK
jgi:hypothetical protein